MRVELVSGSVRNPLMLSLFADQEREAKLDSLGDPLALLDKHMDFAALAAEIDRWAPLPAFGEELTLGQRIETTFLS